MPRRAEAKKTDDRRAQDLLHWLRRERIAADSVQVGDVRVDGIAGLVPSPAVAKASSSVQDRTENMYQRYGGAALAALAKSETGESAVVELDE